MLSLVGRRFLGIPFEIHSNCCNTTITEREAGPQDGPFPMVAEVPGERASELLGLVTDG